MKHREHDLELTCRKVSSTPPGLSRLVTTAIKGRKKCVNQRLKNNISQQNNPTKYNNVDCIPFDIKSTQKPSSQHHRDYSSAP